MGMKGSGHISLAEFPRLPFPQCHIESLSLAAPVCRNIDYCFPLLQFAHVKKNGRDSVRNGESGQRVALGNY